MPIFPRISAGLLCTVLLAGCASFSTRHNTAIAGLNVSGIPILVYHHIHEIPADASASLRRWTLTPEAFEGQMDWIASQGYHIITMAQMLDSLKQGRAMPGKPLVLTFDDGWKDHYTTVLPVLKKHGFAATFFIITDEVGHSAYMDWDQVLALSSDGMDIQAHTVTHPRLPDLTHAQAWHEIAVSKKVLEIRLKKPVTVLAYPYGRYDDEIIAITKDAGYEAAATINGFNGGYLLRADQRYAINRYALEGTDDLPDLAASKGF